MNAKELRSRFSSLSVLVVGDMCLDKNFIGGYSGYSREIEHLPIFRTEKEVYNPGGGGNLCSCFAELGVRTIATGVWGGEEDFNSYILKREFNKRKIDISGMVVGSRTPTFGKVYLRNAMHIYRIDLISEPIPEHAIAEIIDRINDLCNSVDFIACADYEEATDYGVCSENVLRTVAASKRPTFGTSRARVHRFIDFGHILLNTKELTDQSNMPKGSDIQDMVKSLIQALNIDELVVTRGGKGATSFKKNSDDYEALEITSVDSIELVENIDPCGCGDMFFAAYSSSLMAGYDTQTSLKIANSAARVVARKLFGTGQASPEEIESEYRLLYG